VRVVILAGSDPAVESARWRNHMGVPRHLAPIDGEPILYHTVRQLDGHDIYVVGPDDDRYRIPGTTLFIPTITPSNLWADPLLHNRSLRDPDGRTVVLCGDTWFSDDGMSRILNYNEREWRFFCRFGASKMTGCLWGDIWGHSFWPEHVERHDDRLRYVMDLFTSKVISRNGFWEHYRAMAGATGRDVDCHRNLGMVTEIDDWTEDFDFAEDYDKYIARRAELL